MPSGRKQNSISATAFLAFATVASLAPFVHKALHIDDPLFIWAARQIQLKPIDFYGFSINWYGFNMPFYDVAKNPPLASYYIALVTHFFGWKEAVLHLAFLLPAVAAVLGTYFLARQFSSAPLVAALACLATPCFLLSSTTIMCDTMMLSLWVWAVYFWMRGMKEERRGYLIAAAFLAAAAGLTKYYGMSLIGLFLAYSLVRNRRPGYWVGILAVPILILTAYQALTHRLYGRGLLLDAMAYAIEQRDAGALLTHTLTGLSFTGGCFLIVGFYSWLLWRKKTLGAAGLLTLLVMAAYFPLYISRWSGLKNDGVDWRLFVQIYMFSLAGFGILSLAVSDLRKRRDADSLLLFLWIIGTFIFASYLNWSINGRSLLPMAPAVGILIARRLEDRGRLGAAGTAKGVLLLPIALSMAVAFLVSWADFVLAETARTEALAVGREYRAQPTVWFEGHWGFQYYMQEAGAKALDFKSPHFSQGDIVIVPDNNTNLVPFNPGSYTTKRISQLPVVPFITTMQPHLGAGFYSDIKGPLPFVFGPVPNEHYTIISPIVPPAEK